MAEVSTREAGTPTQHLLPARRLFSLGIWVTVRAGSTWSPRKAEKSLRGLRGCESREPLGAGAAGPARRCGVCRPHVPAPVIWEECRGSPVGSTPLPRLVWVGLISVPPKPSGGTWPE